MKIFKSKYTMLMGLAIPAASAFAEHFRYEDTVEDTPMGFPIWTGILLFVLCIASIGGIVVLFLQLQKSKQTSQNELKQLKEIKKLVDCDKQIFDAEIKSLKTQIATMMNLMKSASSTSASKETYDHATVSSDEALNKVVESPQTKSTTGPSATETTQVIQKEVFFGSPQDGIFTRGVEVFSPGSSIYCVTDIGESEAPFTIANRREAKIVARRSISKFLEPACDIAGNTTQNFNEILVRTPGRVKKVNGGWKIIKKAYIELI